MKNKIIPSVVIAISTLLLTCCTHRSNDNSPKVFIHKQSEGEYYVVDINGNKLSDIPFSNIRLPEVGGFDYIFSGKGGSAGYIDTISGEIIIPQRFDNVSPVPNSDLFTVSINAHQGVIDKKKHIVVPIEFNSIKIIDYNGDSCFLCISDSSISKLIRFDGQTMQTYNQYRLRHFESAGQHYLSFKDNDSIGIIDMAGRTLLPAEYQGIATYDKIWILERDNKYRLFSPTRLSAITPWYQSIDKNTNSTYTFCEDKGKYGLIDTSGEIILKAKYKSITQRGNYYVIKDQDNNYGLMDSAFNNIIPFVYKYIYDFRNGLFIVKDNNHKYGVVDKDLNTIIPFEYDQIDFENNNCFRTQKNYNYGIVDTNNQTLIPNEYSSLSILKKQHCYIALKNYKYGIIGFDNKPVLPFKYDKLTPVYDASYFLVSNNNLHGIIDSKGDTILPSKYKEIHTPYGSSTLFITNDGIYDSTGKVISHFKKGYISYPYDKGFIAIKYAKDRYDNRGQIYNTNGKEIAKTRKKETVNYISIDSISLCLITNRSGEKTIVYNTDGKRIIRCRHIYKITRNGKETYEIEKRKGKFGKLIADGNNINIVWY